MANLMPLPKMRFTNAGRPLVGGKVFFYVAGTTIPKNTFKDRSQATANTNPVILDSNGEADIWLEAGYYKVVLKTSSDATVWTQDYVSAPVIGTDEEIYNELITILQGAISGSVNTFFAPTKSAGDTLAASLADGATVITDADEAATPAGVQTRRTVLGGVLSSIVSFLKTSAIAWKHGGAGAVWRTLYARLMDLPVSVKDFGAVGGGVTDDTAAIQFVLSNYTYLQIPPGTWLISQIVVPGGRKILTAGKSTVIQQKSGQPSDTPIIKVTGGNVEIGTFKAVGNIATDTGEFNHVVKVLANSTNGSITNVVLGDIEGQDIRGDVLMLSAYTGYPLKNVRVGNITGDNIFRGVLTITGCDGVKIASVTGSRVGYAHMIIEGETYTTPSANIKIGYIKGSNIIVSGTTSSVYADAVSIDTLDLDASSAGESSPAYPVSPTHALQIRNCKTIGIGNFKAVGYDGQAIRQIYNGGDIAAQAISIGFAEIMNCCKTESVYYTYILGEQGITKIKVDYVKASVTRADVQVFRACQGAIINQVDVVLSASTRLCLACDDSLFNRLKVTGGVGALTQSSSRVTFRGGTVSIGSLASFANACVFEDMTATLSSSVFVGGSTFEDHWIYNSTLNGSFYGSGPYTRSHTQALRFGATWLWADSTGKLRIKSGSVPTSDTDGTVVGTQT